MQINDFFDRIVLINLDRRPDRLAEFEKQSREHGITFVRHSAADAQTLGITGIQACALSHRQVLSDAKADRVARLFIFEDDAEFRPNFASAFEKLARVIPDDWQMLYLCSWRLFPNIDIGIENLKRSEGMILTHAYGMKAEVYDQLIEASKQNMPIDEAFRLLHAKMKVYVAEPSIVVQKAGVSDVRGVFADYSQFII